MAKSSKYSRDKDQNSQYKNIMTTEQDNDVLTQNRISKQFQRLSQNFCILEQFLQTFKNQGLEKQINELTCRANFKQQWENKRKQNHELKYSYFLRQNVTYLTFSILLLIMEIVLIWFLSVFRVFRYQQNRSIFVMCLFIQIFDIGLKSSYLFFLIFKKQNPHQLQVKSNDWFEIYFANFYCLLYAALGLAGLINDTNNQYLIFFQLISIWSSYRRIEQINKDIKMIKFSTEIKNYMKLFSLMSNLILIIHCFAVLMYFSTNFSSPNYLDDIELKQHLNWIGLYVYSFYFSCTTVLTVGYGDILPQNMIQIFIVLLMQVFGVVTIVYLNGQVGNILCSLRREKQNLQNDISVLERLKTNFNLSLETAQKIRQYLIDNRRADEQMHVNEQNTLLEKISSDLRQQASLTNHISILKQSLFLLLNFSAKSQILISNKLIQVIYSPNQKITQVLGKQKLYFIKKGEVSLYISKKDNESQSYRKIVKSIVISNQNKSQCNSFGYLCLIMGKLNRLKMFSKDFSNCYFIENQNFIEAISCDNNDFEKYHEMRETYLNQLYPQINQAESFYNKNDHYICQISKVVDQYRKYHHHSRRRNILRKYKTGKLILEVNEQGISFDQSDSQLDSYPSLNLKRRERNSDKNLNQNSCLTIHQREQKYRQFRSHLMPNSLTNLVVQRKYAKRYCKTAYTKKKIEEQTDLVNKGDKLERLQAAFEEGTNYSFYFSEFNIDMVMRKVNYYTKVLSIFTDMFEKTLAQVNREGNVTCGQVPSESGKKIENYRRQKDFLESVQLTF